MTRLLFPVLLGTLASIVLRADAAPPDEKRDFSSLHSELKDPAPEVRLRAALALAKANDADAIPVLIDLIAELPAENRQPIEEFLTALAGEDASIPACREKNGKKCREAWLAWWNRNDSDALLAAIRKHTPTVAKRRRIAVLLAQLGEDVFARREEASKQLFALGRVALPQLREASKAKDPEVARRANRLIERIEHHPDHRLSLPPVRLLALRKPDSAAAALLAYLPHVEEELQADEVRKALTLLASRKGKLEPALVAALSDERGLIRAVAVEALALGGGTDGRAKARSMLRDQSASVRLKTALALARAGNKDAVPVLIALLTELPLEEVGPAEDALYQLAGDSAPEETAGSEAAERKEYRQAWAAWWNENANRVDLTRLSERPLLGYTLICDVHNDRVYEMDRHGKERWSIANLRVPVDACMVHGNRVLIAEWNAHRVTERDLTGKILWQANINQPGNVQRLSNGNTLVAGYGGEIVEFDRAANALYRIKNVPGTSLAAQRTREGTIVCTNQRGECLFCDTTGKIFKRFATGHGGNALGGLDLMPNGHLLIARRGRDKVAEYDRNGKLVREIAAPSMITATALRNGHILAASVDKKRVYEMDRDGKVVWEHKNAGGAFRARRR